MFRFLLLVLGSLGLSALFMVAEKVRRPLGRLVRAVAIATVSVLTLVGAALAVGGIAEEAWWVAVLGGLFLAGAARIGWALRRRRLRQPLREPDHVPLTRSAAGAHWRRFEANLDWVSRKEAQRSRVAIDRFLAERESPSLSPAHRSLLLSCENRVPELIETCLQRCANASRDERDRYIDDTLETLRRLGEEAEQARAEVREADDRRLDTLHRYFDGVADSRKDQPRLR
jgi:hypothetical protein